MTSIDDLGRLPIRKLGDQPLLLRDVAQIETGTTPGQYDRYNMKRELTLTASLSGVDLGSASADVTQEVLAEGRHFRNPWNWDWRVVRQIEIPQGKVGVRIRLYGDKRTVLFVYIYHL